MAPQHELALPTGKAEGWAAKNDDCSDHDAPDEFRLRDRVQAGVVLDEDGLPLSTGADSVHLYVIDEHFDCWVAVERNPRGDPAAVKHDTLLQARNVYGAGEIRFSVGVIVEIDLSSGTYQVDQEWMDFVQRVVRSTGARIEEDS